MLNRKPDKLGISGKQGENAQVFDVNILCLGKFAIQYNNQYIKWNSRKAEELIALLVEHHPHAVHREFIIDSLWMENDFKKAMTHLNVSIFRARQSLAPIKNNIQIEYDKDYYRLSFSNCHSELAELENMIKNNDKE